MIGRSLIHLFLSHQESCKYCVASLGFEWGLGSSTISLSNAPPGCSTSSAGLFFNDNSASTTGILGREQAGLFAGLISFKPVLSDQFPTGCISRFKRWLVCWWCIAFALFPDIADAQYKTSSPSGKTWSQWTDVCAQDGNKRLCTQAEMCPGGPGQQPLRGFRSDGDGWTAVGDKSNQWVKIENGANMCKNHAPQVVASLPTWGTQPNNAYGRTALCCKDSKNHIKHYIFSLLRAV